MKTNRLPKAVTLFSAAALGASALLLSGGHGRTADHRDAPSIHEDPRADLLDVYVFVNPNKADSVVLIWTINPATVPGLGGIAFSPEVLYDFKIDNDGDFKEDLVIQQTFTSPAAGPQQFLMLGPAKPKRSGGIVNSLLDADKVLSFSGPCDGTHVNGPAGMRAFAALTDDPFFFDVIWTFRLLGITPGGPLTRPPGIDFFAGLNCSTFIVEVPASLLRGPLGNKINVWSTTNRPMVSHLASKTEKEDKNSKLFTQVDREGKPALNTVLIPTARKDEYNRGTPHTDRALFRDQAIATLARINGDAAYSAVLADVLLPDVLTLDLGSTAGYLNGRAPQDDVIDITLNAASKGAVTSDGVNANDKPFPTDFPFVAPPHTTQ